MAATVSILEDGPRNTVISVVGEGDSTLSTVITGLTITDPGEGYLTAPVVTITGAPGTGATATATLEAAGSLKSITLVDGGADYTEAPDVVISGGGGTGATATAVITGDAVTSFVITDPGTGYTAAPTVTITGDGSGAEGTAVLGYAIASLTLTAPGSGYVSPTATIAAPAAGGTVVTATADVDTAEVADELIMPDTLGYIDQARLQRAQFLGIEKAEWDLTNAAEGFIDLIWTDSGDTALRMIGRAKRDFGKGMGGLNPPGPHAPGSTGGIGIVASGMTNGYWFILYLDKRLPNP